MKKLIALVLALAMVALCGAALADSLTVTGVVSSDHTYTAYQIFTGTKASGSDNLGDVAFGTGITSAGQEALYTYYNLTGDNKTVQKLVEAIAAYTGTETQRAQHFAAFFSGEGASYLTSGVDGTISSGNANWTGLDSGYYFIKDTYTGSGTEEGKDYSVARVAVQVVGNTTIQNKADKPTLTKDVNDHSVEVGEVVTFTLNSKVPDTQEYTDYVMTFSDYVTSGLTLPAIEKTNFTVSIGGTAITDYTIESSTKTFGEGDSAVTRNGFKITIDMLNANDTAKYAYNAAIVITYNATVNANAISKVEENYAELEYNNNPSDSSSKGKTPPDIEKVYNAKINVLKVDGTNTTTPLSGAKFVLRVKTLGTTAPHQNDIAAGKYYHYNATNNDVEWVTVSDESASALLANTDITIAETNAQGHADDVFKGLEDGTYELIEIQAPQGYNLLTSPEEVTIAGSDADPSTLVESRTVLNNQGTELPSTGGIGTTIFYILGGLLVVGAAVILVARRKAGQN